MIQESGQDNFRSCLRNFLSGARKKNIKDMSKPFSNIFLRTVPHPVQKMLPYLYWNIFHEKESGTSYQHTVERISTGNIIQRLPLFVFLRKKTLLVQGARDWE